MRCWDDVEAFLLGQATADLTEGDDVAPCLVAFDGDELLLVAFLRSFAKGEYADPLIELVALAAPLDANRLALSIAGRAWSLEDPVVPVVPGLGDLRQRVLTVHRIDGISSEASVTTALHPFTRTKGELRWEPPIREQGATGWLVSALQVAVEQRACLAAPAADVRQQARRCLDLGHALALTDAAAQRMGLDAGAALT